METKQGTPVSPGIVIGPAFLFQTEGSRIPRKFIMPDEAPQEIERFTKAVEKAREQVSAIQQRLSQQVGTAQGLVEIFHAHAQMLSDASWLEQVTGHIKNKLFTAEYATSQILTRYVTALERIDDPYIRQRVGDIYDLERRILNNLLGERREDLAHVTEPVVVVAKSLTPSQTVAMDRRKILAFVTEAGGRTSHTAILARALEIPAVVGVSDACAATGEGDTFIVDGVRGIVVINPDEQTVARYRAMQRDMNIFEAKVSEEVRGLPCITTDGREITLMGNIEFPSDIAAAVEHGASGIGLYRTEFLYHSIETPPDEADHLHAYTQAVEMLGNRPITIRLLDLGADKFGEMYQEANPFLGCRSIRLLLKHEELFRTQLRAIFRASAYGNVRMMLPLVSTVTELREAKRIIGEVHEGLEKEGVVFHRDVPVGIMIEVPSAAVMSDQLAQHCDFFSIGTNDLIQYTLAVDRNNANVAHLYSPADPAVLRLIRTTVEAAHRHNIKVSICGEMAGDLLYSVVLLGLGLEEMSMAAKVIPELKKIIRSISYGEARDIADQACMSASAEENIRLFENKLREILPEAV